MNIRALASGSTGNCWHVTDGATQVLLDCGLRWSRIASALDYRTRDLSAVLVTHEHQDHAKAIPDAMRAGIDVYLTAGTGDALALTGHRLHLLAGYAPFSVGTFTVKPFPTVHDAKEPCGFLLDSGTERLLYVTDTAFIQFRFLRLTKIIIEVNYDQTMLRENVEAQVVGRQQAHRQLWSHLRLDTACDFLKTSDLSRVTEIHLAHLSNRNSDADRFQRAIAQLTGKPVFVA